MIQPMMKELFAPVGRLVKHVGGRLDAMSIDLARDAGAIVRNAQALRETVAGVGEQASSVVRATPRVTKIAQHAAGIFARKRWLMIVNAAKTGEPVLTPDDHKDLAKRVAAAAGELRGGIAKLGQLASCRPDLVGPIWAGELAALQDDVPPVDAALIRAKIERELGRPITEVFAEFDDAPIAAASLAQVHAAVLADGTRVVVKVQVPGIEDVIAADIAALRALAGTLELPGVDLATLSAELGRALAVELDYEAEAAALVAYRGGAQVPRPIAGASTKRVLTMTRLDGARLTDWLDGTLDAGQRDRLIGELVREVAAQILVRGQVHADPHPGNFLVSPDGKLALLDFGCMLELSAADRAAYARLVVAIAGRNHVAASKELVALGFVADDPDQLVDLTASLIGALKPGANAGEIDWQHAFAAQIAQAKQLGGLAIPRSFVLLGRVLVSIAGLLATYKPRLELHALIAQPLAQAVGLAPRAA